MFFLNHIQHYLAKRAERRALQKLHDYSIPYDTVPPRPFRWGSPVASLDASTLSTSTSSETCGTGDGDGVSEMAVSWADEYGMLWYMPVTDPPLSEEEEAEAERRIDEEMDLTLASVYGRGREFVFVGGVDRANH
jgi:hypothetical protein